MKSADPVKAPTIPARQPHSFRFDHIGVFQKTFIVKAESEQEARSRLALYCFHVTRTGEDELNGDVESRPLILHERSHDLPVTAAPCGSFEEQKLLARQLRVLSLRIKTRFREVLHGH